MSILNSSKFNVLRGWTPGGDAGLDPALPPGTGLTFTPGSFGRVHTDGPLIFPAAPSTAQQPLMLVVNGNTTNEYDTNFVGKVQCLVGKFIIKTDVHTGGGFTRGAQLTVNAAGQLLVDAVNLRVGYVLEDNTSVDGTITAVIDI